MLQPTLHLLAQLLQLLLLALQARHVLAKHVDAIRAPQDVLLGRPEALQHAGGGKQGAGTGRGAQWSAIGGRRGGLAQPAAAAAAGGARSADAAASRVVAMPPCCFQPPSPVKLGGLHEQLELFCLALVSRKVARHVLQARYRRYRGRAADSTL